MQFRLSGLIAATFTPLTASGSLNLAMARPIVDRLIHNGVSGIYVCGSSGEGPLLTTVEREATAAAYAKAAQGRLPVVVQVGHSSVIEARQLAAHAQQIGATAISAVAPYYFKPDSIHVLVDCLAEIASGASSLPFYYYHIPALSGVNFDMIELVQRAAEKIPTFTGVKYSMPTTDELQSLISLDDGRYDILFGRDEMILSALVVGVRGVVGSTYNFAAPLYCRLMTAFHRGDLSEARHCQELAISMIRTIVTHYRFHAGLKATMGLIGLDCGSNRLPIVSLKTNEIADLRSELDSLGFFQWAVDSNHDFDSFRHKRKSKDHLESEKSSCSVS